MFNPDEIAARVVEGYPRPPGIEGLSTDELLNKAIRFTDRFFSSAEVQPERLTAGLWLLHRELTLRGIAPAYRGLPRPPRGVYVPSLGTYEPLPEPQRNALALCRLIDLEWLGVHGRSRPFNRLTTRLTTDLRSAQTTDIINLVQDRHRLVDRLALHPDDQRTLQFFCSRTVLHRRLTAQRRATAVSKRIADAARGGRYRLPDQDVARRTEWVHAIELAKLEKPKPSNADLVRWLCNITGRVCSRQGAGKMRRTLQAGGFV